MVDVMPVASVGIGIEPATPVSASFTSPVTPIEVASGSQPLGNLLRLYTNFGIALFRSMSASAVHCLLISICVLMSGLISITP